MRLSRKCYIIPPGYQSISVDTLQKPERLATWLSTLLYEVESRKSDIPKYKNTHVPKESVLKRLKEYIELKALTISLSALFKLWDNLVDPALKAAIITKLQEGYDNCTEGFHDRVDFILRDLRSCRTITQHLARQRQFLVDITANSVTNEVHARQKFDVQAAELYLGIVPVNVADQFVGAIPFDTIKSLLKQTFAVRFKPWQIMASLLDSLQTQLKEWGGYLGEPKPSGYSTEELYRLTELLAEFFEIDNPGYFDIYQFFICKEKPDNPYEMLAIELNWPRIHRELLDKFLHTGYLIKSLNEKARLETLLTGESLEHTRDILDLLRDLTHDKSEFEAAFTVLNMLSPLQAWIMLCDLHNDIDHLFQQSGAIVKTIFERALKNYSLRSDSEELCLMLSILVMVPETTIGYALHHLTPSTQIIHTALLALPEDECRKLLRIPTARYVHEANPLIAAILEYPAAVPLILFMIQAIPVWHRRDCVIFDRLIEINAEGNNTLMLAVLSNVISLEPFVELIRCISDKTTSRSKLVQTLLSQTNAQRKNVLGLTAEEQSYNMGYLLELLQFVTDEAERVKLLRTMLLNEGKEAVNRCALSNSKSLELILSAIETITDEKQKTQFLEELLFSQWEAGPTVLIEAVFNPESLALIFSALKKIKNAEDRGRCLRKSLMHVNMSSQQRFFSWPIFMIAARFAPQSLSILCDAWNSVENIQERCFLVQTTIRQAIKASAAVPVFARAAKGGSQSVDCILELLAFLVDPVEREELIIYMLRRRDNLNQKDSSLHNPLVAAICTSRRAVGAIIRVINSISNQGVRDNLLTDILGDIDPKDATCFIKAAELQYPDAFLIILNAVDHIQDIGARNQLLARQFMLTNKWGVSVLEKAVLYNPVLIPVIFNVIGRFFPEFSELNKDELRIREELSNDALLGVNGKGWNILKTAVVMHLDAQYIKLIFTKVREWVKPDRRADCIRQMFSNFNLGYSNVFLCSLTRDTNTYELILQEAATFFSQAEFDEFVISLLLVHDTSGKNCLLTAIKTCPKAVPFIIAALMNRSRIDLLQTFMTHRGAGRAVLRVVIQHNPGLLPYMLDTLETMGIATWSPERVGIIFDSYLLHDAIIQKQDESVTLLIKFMHRLFALTRYKSLFHAMILEIVRFVKVIEDDVPMMEHIMGGIQLVADTNLQQELVLLFTRPTISAAIPTFFEIQASTNPREFCAVLTEIRRQKLGCMLFDQMMAKSAQPNVSHVLKRAVENQPQIVPLLLDALFEDSKVDPVACAVLVLNTPGALCLATPQTQEIIARQIIMGYTLDRQEKTMEHFFSELFYNSDTPVFGVCWFNTVSAEITLLKGRGNYPKKIDIQISQLIGSLSEWLSNELPKSISGQIIERRIGEILDELRQIINEFSARLAKRRLNFIKKRCSTADDKCLDFLNGALVRLEDVTRDYVLWSQSRIQRFEPDANPEPKDSGGKKPSASGQGLFKKRFAEPSTHQAEAGPAAEP